MKLKDKRKKRVLPAFAYIVPQKAVALNGTRIENFKEQTDGKSHPRISGGGTQASEIFNMLSGWV